MAGAAIVWLVWGQAARDGQFSGGGAMIGPATVVLGLGLLAFPGYRSERLARGEEAGNGLAALTPRWRAVLGVALAAGLAHLFLLYYGVLPR